MTVLGEEGGEDVAPLLERVDVMLDLVAPVARLHDRSEGVDHRLRPDDLVVAGGQRGEMRDDFGDFGLGVERFEHPLADELVETADGLHRHRLMEQVQRLVAGDAEAAAQGLRVRRVAVVDRRLAAPQSLAQVVDVTAEVDEVRFDGQRGVGGDVEPVGLAGVGVGNPEHLGEGDVDAEGVVGEHAQDHAVGGGSAQRDRAGAVRCLNPLGLVVAEHVRTQVPLLRVGARSLVVGDLVGRQQQGGHRVHQRGLAGPDSPGQQSAAAVDPETPDGPMERAPVEHL